MLSSTTGRASRIVSWTFRPSSSSTGRASITVSMEPVSLTLARELTRELTTELVPLVRVLLTLRGVGAAVNKVKYKLEVSIEEE